MKKSFDNNKRRSLEEETAAQSTAGLKKFLNQSKDAHRHRPPRKTIMSKTAFRLVIMLALLLTALLLLTSQECMAQPARTMNAKALLNPDGTILWYQLDLHDGEITKYLAEPQEGRYEEISRTRIAHMDFFDKTALLTSFCYQQPAIVKRGLLSLPFISLKRGGFKEYQVTKWFPFKDAYKEYAYVFRWDEEAKNYTSTKDLIKEKECTRGWFNALLITYIIIGLFILWRLGGIEDAGFFHALYHGITLFLLFGLYLQPLNGFVSTATTTITITIIIILALSVILSMARTITNTNKW